MGAGKGEKRKKGRESARKPGKTNAVRRKRGESHDFSAIALPGCTGRKHVVYLECKTDGEQFQTVHFPVLSVSCATGSFRFSEGFRKQ